MDIHASKLINNPTLGGNCHVRTHVPVLVGGAEAKTAEGKNPNPFYAVTEASKPVMGKNSLAPEAALNLKKR